MSLRLLSLDLSLSATGLAWTHHWKGPAALGCATVHTRRHIAEGIDHRRIHDVFTAIKPHTTHKPDLVVIEWLPQFDGHGDASLRLAELHGVIRHYLWVNQIPMVDVRPTHLQMYATGKGRATKTEVREAVTATYGRLVHIGSEDEADAFALLAAALHQYGAPLADVPATHRRALSAVTWPELDYHPLADALAAGTR